jgi:hypothetical protein
MAEQPQYPGGKVGTGLSGPSQNMPPVSYNVADEGQVAGTCASDRLTPEPSVMQRIIAALMVGFTLAVIGCLGRILG